MQKSTKSLTAVTAAGAIAMLALVGCSSDPEGNPAGDQSGPAPQSNVYDFKTPSHAAEGEVTIQIPDELREVAGGDAEKLLVSSAKATPHELDSSKYCAVDLAIEYSNGGSKTLIKNNKAEPSLTRKYSQKERNGIIEDVQNGSSEYDDLVAEAGTDEPVELGRYLASLQVPEKPKPAWNNLIRALTIREGQLVSELDAADPEPGTYLSDDHETLTFVQSCATSPTDDQNARYFILPTSDGDSTPKFATFDIATMKNGTIAIIDGKVEDYERDSNGDWIAD